MLSQLRRAVRAMFFFLLGRRVYVMNAAPGAYVVTGDRATLVDTYAAEAWQFFAFVFAALVTLALTLLDEIPDRYQQWRILSKIVVFIAFGWITLFCWRAKKLIIRVLPVIKTRSIR